MIRQRSFFPAFLLLFLFAQQLHAQVAALPRSTPETEGVSSRGIIQFLDAVNASKHEMHSLMILRHGKVIAEGWWKPYRPDLKHTLYSLSKSFTSTAVGFAVSEKRLSVNDKVISFFPDKLPDTVSEHLASMTVKDLLSMAAGQEPDPTPIVATMHTDWVKGFFATPVLHKPGSVFLYNSVATYMLSVIVQKLTGEKIIDYLKPRLFDPLGITGMDWEIDPQGINVGGWGLRVKTEDIARFGQLYLQKGKWNGKQLIPEAWIEEATTFKVDNAPGATQSKKDSSDWMQGYCYQFWRSRHDSYRGDGAFGQYVLVLPELDAVIAITSETSNMQEELNLVWQYILPALKADKSSLNKKDAALLKQRLNMLKLALPARADTVTTTTVVNGKIFQFAANAKKIESISFAEKNKQLSVTIKTDSASYDLPFDEGKWHETTTTMLGPSLVGAAKAHFLGLPASQVAGAYRWKSTNELELQLRYIDSPHALLVNFNFTENKLVAEFRDSFAPPDRKIILEGKLAP